MPRDIMSEQQMNIKFVKAVQQHPSLYNFELPSYTRKDISDKAWEDVGKTMNMTPPACRERWRNLRAVFMRTMKAPPPKGTGKKKPYYLSDVMQFVLPFMRPLAVAEAAKEKQKQLQSNQAKETKPTENIEVAIENIKVEMDDESDEWGSLSNEEVPNIRKRSAQDDELHQSKAVKLAQPSSSTTLENDHAKSYRPAQPSSSTMTVETDHVKSFLNSLVPELNEMNSVQFKNFKRRVLLLIDDIMTEIPASPRRRDGSDYVI